MAEVRFRYRSRPFRVRLLARPNRFLALLRRESDGLRFEAHVPNPGRMEELLVPGETVGFAVPVVGGERRTHADLVSVYHGRTLVSIDTRIANSLVGLALRSGRLTGAGPGAWLPELRWGRHRFDFGQRSASSRSPIALLEVKSSNLRIGPAAGFPDAPTVRGRRHLEALAMAVRRRIRADVVFVVQRADVTEFRPNRALDPAFARAFDSAVRARVGMHAIRLEIFPRGARLGPELAVVGA